MFRVLCGVWLQLKVPPFISSVCLYVPVSFLFETSQLRAQLMMQALMLLRVGGMRRADCRVGGVGCRPGVVHMWS